MPEHPLGQRRPLVPGLGASLGVLAAVFILGLLAIATRYETSKEPQLVLRLVSSAGRAECDHPAAVRDPLDSETCLQLGDVITGEIAADSLEMGNLGCPCVPVRVPSEAIDTIVTLRLLRTSLTLLENPTPNEASISPITRLVFHYRDRAFFFNHVLDPEPGLFRVYIGDERLAREILATLDDT
jgi:hypothetical protein